MPICFPLLTVFRSLCVGLIGPAASVPLKRSSNSNIACDVAEVHSRRILAGNPNGIVDRRVQGRYHGWWQNEIALASVAHRSHLQKLIFLSFHVILHEVVHIAARLEYPSHLCIRVLNSKSDSFLRLETKRYSQVCQSLPALFVNKLDLWFPLSDIPAGCYCIQVWKMTPGKHSQLTVTTLNGLHFSTRSSRELRDLMLNQQLSLFLFQANEYHRDRLMRWFLAAAIRGKKSNDLCGWFKPLNIFNKGMNWEDHALDAL